MNKITAKKKTILWVVMAFAAVVLLCVYPLVTIKDSEFGGTDGAASDLIMEIAPDYEPWIDPVIELPGGETESFLFCLQAALGSGVLFFSFGYLVAAKKYKRKAEEDQ